MVDLTAFLRDGKLTALPSKRKKRLAALSWLADHIPPEREYTEREFGGLLNELHTFGDPAALRRELYDAALIDRSPDGSGYRLNPGRPSWEELLARYCGDLPAPAPPPEKEPADPGGKPEASGSGRDLADAAEFRDRIHAEALRIVRRVRPEAADVVDRYPVEAYLQRHWDYPGTWYVIAAIPEGEKSRESLINTIVMDTLARVRETSGKK